MIIKKIFSDVSYIEPEIYKDDRGSFSEIFNQELFKKNNLKINYIQDNFSFSELKNTIRGLHFQKKDPQSQLVTLVYGKIFDVIVDPDSTVTSTLFPVTLAGLVAPVFSVELFEIVKNSPHTESEICGQWTHGYTREEACFIEFVNVHISILHTMPWLFQSFMYQGPIIT